MNNDLHVKYRPQDFDELVGQEAVIKSLKAHEAKGTWPHAFLFVGGAGCGKTTLARIIARKLGTDKNNILEIDAASRNGIDDMRDLQQDLNYAAFGSNPTKVIILDECHSITKPAWQSLLKTIEEPPKHVYFFFCTTEVDKVPDTIKTRCLVYTLSEVGTDDIFDLISVVSEEEEINLPEKSLSLIASACMGSPRRALTMLAKCRGLEDAKEIRSVLQEPDSEEGEVIELCRALIKGVSFMEALAIVKKLEGQNPESIRLVTLAYVSKVLLNSKNEQQATKLLAIMDAFSKPFYQSEKMAPLLLALGGLLI